MATKRTGDRETRPVNAGVADGEPITIDGSSGVTPENSDAGGENRIPVVEPIRVAAEQPADGKPDKRGRGRPIGSPNVKGTKADKETANDLAGLLVGIHEMLATFTQIEEFELEEGEAERLGKAVARVNKLYNGFMLTEKQMAWSQLIMACGGIYGTRIMSYKLRRAAEEKKNGKVIDAEPVNVGPAVSVAAPVDSWRN